MKDIIVKKRSERFFIPIVSFCVDTGICEISGKSFLENSFDFYNPLNKWLKDYSTEINKPLTLNFRLEYFNTSSAKQIVELLYTTKKYKDAGGSVEVNWYISEEDYDLKDEIEDFQTVAGIDINIIILDSE